MNALDMPIWANSRASNDGNACESLQDLARKSCGVVHLPQARVISTRFHIHWSTIDLLFKSINKNIAHHHFVWKYSKYRGHSTTMFLGFWSLRRSPRWTFPTWKTPHLAVDLYVGVFMDFPQASIILAIRSSSKSDPSKFGTSPFLSSRWCLPSHRQGGQPAAGSQHQ